MGGSLVPWQELYVLSPAWRSAFDHDVTPAAHHTYGVDVSSDGSNIFFALTACTRLFTVSVCAVRCVWEREGLSEGWSPICGKARVSGIL